MGELGDTRGYLELSKDPVRFEPVSKVTNVFFDDTSKEVSGLLGERGPDWGNRNGLLPVS